MIRHLQRKVITSGFGLALLTLLGVGWGYHHTTLQLISTAETGRQGYIITGQASHVQTRTIFIVALVNYSLSLALLCLVYYLLNRQITLYQPEVAQRTAELSKTNERLQTQESDRFRAEAALRHSVALFRSLSESSPIGIFRTDTRGKCIYTNPRCQAIWGCTFEETLGDGFLQFAHPDDLKLFLPQWSKAAAGNREFSGELRYHHRDGSIRFCRVRIAAIFSTEQELIGHVGTVEDITESRALEKIKNELILIVSHELRTPLTSIRGSLGLLTSGRLDSQPQRARRMLEIAAIDTDRLVHLVNDILDLERLESGKLFLVKDCCDAATLMLRSVEAVRPLAEEANVTLTVSPLPVQVWANPDRIIQTLVNLLGNAVKFSPPRSTVWLSAELLTSNTPQVLFQVRDRGRGIPADKLESIFGWFQQVDASDSRDRGGTGLGLAICRSIVQQHGGQIWAESVLEQGSTFYFTLPLTP